MLDTPVDQLVSRLYKDTLWAAVSISPETQKENSERDQIEAVIDQKLAKLRSELLRMWDSRS